MKLVQTVVNQGGITAAFARILLQGAVRPQPSGSGSQPAAHPEALEAES